MCEFISQSYTYVSCSSPLSLFLRNLRRNSLDLNETYADNRNIICSKRERCFLRNFFVICEFLTQRYSWILRKQLANTLFVEYAKWDLVARRGPWWKIKYPQIITRWNLLRDCLVMCDFITQSSTLPFLKQFASTVLVDSAKWYLVAHWGLWWKSKYPQTETGKNPSEKLHCEVRM